MQFQNPVCNLEIQGSKFKGVISQNDKKNGYTFLGISRCCVIKVDVN